MFQIVVVAASMGGPQAVRGLLASLPAAFPAAVVVVQHRGNEVTEITADVLRRRTTLPVRMAQTDARPAAGVIDVAPAQRQLVLATDGRYYVGDRASRF